MRIAISLFIYVFLLIGQAHALNIKTGSYTGNATDNRNITGVGFQPDFVLIRGQNSSSGAFRTSSMAGDSSFQNDAGGAQANFIQSLSSDGFQLGTSTQVNDNGVTFSYIAIKADSTNFKVGTYTGDGVDGHAITGVGFAPSGCMVRHDSTSYREPAWSSSDMGANAAFIFADDNFGPSAGVIKSLDSDGFSVGTNGQYSNGNAETYYYACWKDSAGLMKTGTYSGNGADNRSITGVGFLPKFLWVQGGTTGFMETHLPGQGVADDLGYPLYLNGGFSNTIQAREADGFQVGTSEDVNTNAKSYYYWAITDGSGSGGGGGGGGTGSTPNTLL